MFLRPRLRITTKVSGVWCSSFVEQLDEIEELEQQIRLPQKRALFRQLFVA